MPDPALRDRLDRVRQVLAERQGARGWTHPVRIVAVTKTHPVSAVRAAVEAGLEDVGENRVQEALAKQQAAAGLPVTWHLIGTLQRNKARHAAGAFGMIHSVDGADLARELDRRTPETRIQDVLVQVNCSGEPQKGGVEPDALWSLLDAIRDCRRLAVRGLMTMAAYEADEPELRRTFALLRRLRDEGPSRGWPLTELSMGMSDDYPIAVEEGATMLRLGTALFGARTPA